MKTLFVQPLKIIRSPYDMRQNELKRKQYLSYTDLVTENGAVLEHVSDTFKNTETVVAAAVQSDGEALKHASDKAAIG